METLRNIFLAIGFWTYIVAGVEIFLEASAFFGLILPGDTVVVLLGVLAGMHALSVWGAAIVAVCCCFAGDLAGYSLGRYRGESVLAISRHLRLAYQRRKDWLNQDIRKYGVFIVPVGRFTPFIRAFTPFAVGLARLSWPRYVFIAALSAIAWGGCWFGVGLALGYNWRLLDKILAPLGGGLTGVVIIAALGYAAWRWRHELKVMFTKLRRRQRLGIINR